MTLHRDQSIFTRMERKSKRFQLILLVSLAANLVAAAYFGKKLYTKFQAGSTAATVPSKPAYYLDRDKLFAVLPKDTGAIVFLGNSLTQYFELAEMLNNPLVRNRGIHGDMSEGLLQRLSPIIASQPKKIFIEIGINDLEQKISKEKFLSNYQRLIDTLQANCTNTKIYVQSLLPVADSSQRLASYCSPEMNRLVVEVNNELQQLASKKGCTYLNVHQHLLKGTELNPLYSVDGVHLSGEGYLQWAKILRPYVGE